ncbi:hypothetical protein B0H11DRAFT_1921794 [Mycena galericulata]|nr:hypothetical protein B0H11DRAFT_1921794 [Mycena galericulata]
MNILHRETVGFHGELMSEIGAFFGALGSAPMSAKIGRQYTLLGVSVIFVVGAVRIIFSQCAEITVDPDHTEAAENYAGRVITGIGIGGICTILLVLNQRAAELRKFIAAVSPAFVSECSPKEVFMAFGVMISYWFNYGIGIHIRPGPKLWRIHSASN